MNNKLIEELEKHIDTQIKRGDMPPWMAQDFDEIISRYKEQEREQGDGLSYKEIPCGIRLEIMDVVGGNKSTGKAVENIMNMFSRHQSNSEPLEDLAKRKAVAIFSREVRVTNGFGSVERFDSESKARAYLESLPDVKEERKL